MRAALCCFDYGQSSSAHGRSGGIHDWPSIPAPACASPRPYRRTDRERHRCVHRHGHRCGDRVAGGRATAGPLLLEPWHSHRVLPFRGNREIALRSGPCGERSGCRNFTRGSDSPSARGRRCCLEPLIRGHTRWRAGRDGRSASGCHDRATPNTVSMFYIEIAGRRFEVVEVRISDRNRGPYYLPPSGGFSKAGDHDFVTVPLKLSEDDAVSGWIGFLPWGAEQPTYGEARAADVRLIAVSANGEEVAAKVPGRPPYVPQG